MLGRNEKAELKDYWGAAIFMGTFINPDFVIPAQAGIQLNQASGFRGKPGMTIDRSALMILQRVRLEVRI